MKFVVGMVVGGAMVTTSLMIGFLSGVGIATANEGWARSVELEKENDELKEQLAKED